MGCNPYLKCPCQSQPIPKCPFLPLDMSKLRQTCPKTKMGCTPLSSNMSILAYFNSFKHVVLWVAPQFIKFGEILPIVSQDIEWEKKFGVNKGP